MATKAKSFEFHRRPNDPVRYVVNSDSPVSESDARKAFENYVAKQFRISDRATVVKIRFDEWIKRKRPQAAPAESED